MWSSSKKDQCARSVLLAAISIACICLVFISLAYTDRKQKIDEQISTKDSIFSERLVEDKCIPVCDSKNCVFQANMLLKSINPEVDPCEDFHTFLCGTFEQRFGANESGLSGISQAHMMMLYNMKSSIENINARPGSASHKLKIMYDSCVNIGSSDLTGFENFQKFLNKVEILNWPYLSEDFTFSEAGLPILLGTFASYLEAIFISISIQSESEEGSNETYVKVLVRPNLVEFPSAIQRNAAVEILTYFDIGIEDIELILNDYDEVKNAVLHLQDENATRCEENCKNVRIDCLNTEDNDWVNLCKTVQVSLNLSHVNDCVTTSFISIEEDNVSPAKNIIPRLKSLSDRSVANFFALRLLWNHLDEINFFFRRQKQKYFKFFITEDTKKPKMEINRRWLYCTEWIGEHMKLPLEKEYIQKYFKKSIIDEILDIQLNYTSEMSDMITRQEWISVESRTLMENWVRNLKSSLFNLEDVIPNETLVNDYMSKFQPTEASFFLNVLEYRKITFSIFLRHKLDVNSLETPTFKVNAAYGEDGVIDYHYGIVFPPFHYPSHKRLINQILFVPIVAHEIGHSVVDLLTQIAKIGNSTRRTFLEKQHCIENQFSKFEFKYLQEKLNGTKYTDENLSDNLAQIFLDKLLENFESSEDAISLPGLLFSPKQQLYMSAKEGFCSKSNLISDIHFNTKDKHAPFEYRIIGTMQNSRGYTEAFRCAEGSYMNPIMKCSLLD